MTDDPKQHTQKIKDVMQELVTHFGEDVGKAREPRDKVHFEMMEGLANGVQRP